MRSKLQNKLRRRISRRHSGGKPSGVFNEQIELALAKIIEAETILRAVLDESRRAEEKDMSLAAPKAKDDVFEIKTTNAEQVMVEAQVRASEAEVAAIIERKRKEERAKAAAAYLQKKAEEERLKAEAESKKKAEVERLKAEAKAKKADEEWLKHGEEEKIRKREKDKAIAAAVYLQKKAEKAEEERLKAIALDTFNEQKRADEAERTREAAAKTYGLRVDTFEEAIVRLPPVLPFVSVSPSVEESSPLNLEDRVSESSNDDEDEDDDDDDDEDEDDEDEDDDDEDDDEDEDDENPRD